MRIQEAALLRQRRLQATERRAAAQQHTTQSSASARPVAGALPEAAAAQPSVASHALRRSRSRLALALIPSSRQPRRPTRASKSQAVSASEAWPTASSSHP